jgi:CDGSH-type Zn-finger protein
MPARWCAGHISGMPKVTCQLNGPYIVDGVTEIFDASGKPFDLGGRTRFALCRCSHSKNKPFCDGGHKAGFQADDVAPRRP